MNHAEHLRSIVEASGTSSTSLASIESKLDDHEAWLASMDGALGQIVTQTGGTEIAVESMDDEIGTSGGAQYEYFQPKGGDDYWVEMLNGNGAGGSALDENFSGGELIAYNVTVASIYVRKLRISWTSSSPTFAANTIFGITHSASLDIGLYNNSNVFQSGFGESAVQNDTRDLIASGFDFQQVTLDGSSYLNTLTYTYDKGPEITLNNKFGFMLDADFTLVDWARAHLLITR